MRMFSWRWPAALAASILLLGLTACDDSSSGGSVTGKDGAVIDGDGGPDTGREPDPDAGDELDAAPPPDGGPDAALDAGPDATPIDEPTPCAPCEADDDCSPAGSLCLDIGGGRFCGVACEGDEDCDEGYGCEDQGDGVGQCVPDDGNCAAVVQCQDADGDGYGVGPGCLGMDCDDGDDRAHEGAAEVCDGVDNDCDGEVDEEIAGQSCGVGACAATSACVDGVMAECIPGAPAADDATCDGVDDDCDGTADEDYAPTTCGAGLCVARSRCEDGVEVACVPPPAPAPNDANCNGDDDDCDGRIDEDYVGEACGMGACAMVGVCQNGAVACTPGDPIAADDATCNNVDDDCDGNTDEDFRNPRECGFGVCRTTTGCFAGVVECRPLPPQAADDATCDGIDQDCDGLVDEDCQQNFLSYQLVAQGEGFIDVNVVYEQIHSPANDGSFWQPRAIELRPAHPATLALRTPNNQGVVPGQAVIDAQKSVNVISKTETEARIVILSQANTNRIGPGVLVTLRFIHDPGVSGPFDFGFNEERTNFAPEESGEVLQFRSASLGQ